MDTLDYPLYMLIGLGMIALIALILLFGFAFHLRKSLTDLNDIIQNAWRFSNLDILTGLPNRILFFDNFKNCIENAKRNHEKVALLFMDIDNFRQVKDTLGYAIGDDLLQSIAKRMLVAMNNAKELMAHLTSDQFIIIIENIPHEKMLHESIEKILTVFEEPFSLADQRITTCASIGISLYPLDGTTVETLLKKAGIARHHAKQLAGNSYNFYASEMDATLMQQRSIEEKLRMALENKELLVCYQPKVDVISHKIMGAEALLQWNNPELGKISPAQFIPIAEKTGLIMSIGNWILREACNQTQQWHTQGFSDFSIAVNLSAYQFKSGDIAEQVANALWDSKLNPNFLELELTESLVMENIEKSLLMLRVLKTMGIKISIDDFGTGYSSLSQLSKFPADSLKIDQSFVRNINLQNLSADGNAIINAIVTLAKQLHLKIIAEGVETEQQLDFLKQQGCDLIQGFIFSRPIPAEEFGQLLANNRQKHK